MSFSTCLFVGVATSQVLAYLFAATDAPDSFTFLGMFGVILGVFGGFLANLLCVDRIPWYYVIVGFGLLLLGLLVIQSPNYSAAAKLIAVIAFTQMLASLGVGVLNRQAPARGRTTWFLRQAFGTPWLFGNRPQPWYNLPQFRHRALRLGRCRKNLPLCGTVDG